MLYQAFQEHPEIGMAKNIKETNFFNNEYHRGIDWYRSFFEHCEGKRAIGEVSNTYVYNPKVPARIARFLPDVQLITVLRNPFDRIRSAYLFRQRSGEIDSQLSFEEAIQQHPDLIKDNYYGDQLGWYLNLFPRENLMIAFFDDLKKDPAWFIRDIFAFIGVNADFEPTVIYERVNRAAEVRHPILASLIRFGANRLRQWQCYAWLGHAKNSETLRKLFFKPVSLNRVNYSKEVRALLEEHFVPHIQKVEKIANRSLVHWYT